MRKPLFSKKGFNLTIPAIVSRHCGQNGVGKTTLAKLLCRLNDQMKALMFTLQFTGSAVHVAGTVGQWSRF
jgi:ABC-type Mn2+/Zn2+ transport system ATPase subunit